MRRVELGSAIVTAIGAIGAIVAILVAPISSTTLMVDGHLVSTTQIYARDHGVAPMVLVCLATAALAACVLYGAWLHAKKGDASGRPLIWSALVAYVALGLWGIEWGGSYAQVPAILAIICGLCALLPGRPLGTELADGSSRT